MESGPGFCLEWKGELINNQPRWDGALPKAFLIMIKYLEQNKLIVSHVNLDDGREITIFCNEDDLSEIENRIKKWAKDNIGQFKEWIDFAPSKYRIKPSADPTVGWIELDNGFIFTEDEQMAKGFQKLFFGEKE